MNLNRLVHESARALGYPTLAGKSSPFPAGWLLRCDRASSGIPEGNLRQFRLRFAAGSGPDCEQRPAILLASLSIIHCPGRPCQRWAWTPLLSPSRRCSSFGLRSHPTVSFLRTTRPRQRRHCFRVARLHTGEQTDGTPRPLPGQRSRHGPSPAATGPGQQPAPSSESLRPHRNAQGPSLRMSKRRSSASPALRPAGGSESGSRAAGLGPAPGPRPAARATRRLSGRCTPPSESAWPRPGTGVARVRSEPPGQLDHLNRSESPAGTCAGPA